MDSVAKYLKNKNVYFDKIISSYALYYAKNPIKVIYRVFSSFLKPNGCF